MTDQKPYLSLQISRALNVAKDNIRSASRANQIPRNPFFCEEFGELRQLQLRGKIPQSILPKRERLQSQRRGQQTA